MFKVTRALPKRPSISVAEADIEVTATDLVAVAAITVAVAPEVAPETISPVVYEAEPIQSTWVNISTSNR